MKHFLLFILKPLSFLPALLVMYMIFSFSGQTGEISSGLSYQVSYKIVTLGEQVLDHDLTEEETKAWADRIHGPVRKLAHMTEYFILAVSVSFPLYVYGLRGFPLLLLAGIVCVGFACGDEYHQSFIEGRGPSKRDVVIDSIGALLGIMVVRIFCWTVLAPVRWNERRKRRLARRRKRRRT